MEKTIGMLSEVKESIINAYESRAAWPVRRFRT